MILVNQFSHRGSNLKMYCIVPSAAGLINISSILFSTPWSVHKNSSQSKMVSFIFSFISPLWTLHIMIGLISNNFGTNLLNRHQSSWQYYLGNGAPFVNLDSVIWIPFSAWESSSLVSVLFFFVGRSFHNLETLLFLPVSSQPWSN